MSLTLKAAAVLFAAFTTTGPHGYRQGEKVTTSAVGNPSFNGSFYVASVPSPTTFTVAQAGPDAASGGGSVVNLFQGGSVTGGCFYDSSAVPAAYRGNFFYGDYISGNFIRATLNATNGVSSVDYFGTGITNLIDIAVGPDGALYVVDMYHGIIQHRVYLTSYLRSQSEDRGLQNVTNYGRIWRVVPDRQACL